jgi:phosphate starvation-inducible protein PhoH and related proteins
LAPKKPRDKVVDKVDICPGKYKKRPHLQIEQTLAEHDVVFFIGPSGTGKTADAMHWIMRAMNQGVVETVVVTRPQVTCGERSGFLPGDEREKLSPYLMSFLDVLSFLIGRQHAGKQLASFEAWPIGMIRGRTVSEKTVAILDEAQNCTIDQLHMFCTRLGYGGKLILTGDYEQGDLAGGGWHFEMVAQALADAGEAGIVRYTDADVLRHSRVAGINRVFRKIKGTDKPERSGRGHG